MAYVKKQNKKSPVQCRELNSVLCGDLDSGMGGGVGGTAKREGIYVYLELIGFVIHHCKTIIPQFFLKVKKKGLH